MKARDEKDFREWPSHIGRDVRPKREIRFAPRWRAPPLPPLLEGLAENVALAPISACSRIGSMLVPPSLRVKRMTEAVLVISLVKTRRPPGARSGCRGSLGVAVGGPFLR